MVALIVPDVAPRHRLFPYNRGREENRKIARISNFQTQPSKPAAWLSGI
jgi:hypothetical protein